MHGYGYRLGLLDGRLGHRNTSFVTSAQCLVAVIVTSSRRKVTNYVGQAQRDIPYDTFVHRSGTACDEWTHCDGRFVHCIISVERHIVMPIRTVYGPMGASPLLR